MHCQKLIQEATQVLYSCESFKQKKEWLLELINNNQQWRQNRCLNLVAAESLLSHLARSLLASDLSQRTAGGHIGEKNRCFVATRYIDQIESLCHSLLHQLFECNHCDPRLLGGTQSCQLVYSALTKPNDTILAVMPQFGGDSSNSYCAMPGFFNLKIIPIPFLSDNITIDLAMLDFLVERHRPSLISLGFSVCLFEQPLAEIKKIAQNHRVKLYYDAAHELGLIAGKCFRNPFEQGVDVVSGSTGKTFSGPQGGLLLWQDSALNSSIVSLVFPHFVGTYQLNRVAALAITALELLEYGQHYMQQMVVNAKALAHCLANLDVPVFAKEYGFTQTHQILIDARSYGGGFAAAKRLEQCNIIGNHVQIPGDISGVTGGLRLATTEITRRGMKSSHMKQIAELIARALFTKEPAQTIAQEATSLNQMFQSIHYSADYGVTL